jgi:protoporphyrinogen oxidase
MDYDVIVIGAGPAGLTAAYELARLGQRVLVIEQSHQVGGISRTENYRGYRFDIGGHRFFTRVPEIEQLWRETLGADLLTVQRQSRIYYRGRFFKYPISLSDALLKLGVIESARILGSYFLARIAPHRQEDTFEQWVSNRFGRRLYETFFKTYTEKVWGMPCASISADWAAQRIKGLSLSSAIMNALTGAANTKSLIISFLYPRLGPGMMWEALAERARALGAEVELGARAVAVVTDDPTTMHVEIETATSIRTLTTAQVISSAPLSELVRAIRPEPPAAVGRAADCLRYRDFVLVLLLVKAKDLFPDNWLYVHSPEVKVGRIQNSKNWSAALTPDPDMTSLGMEYFSTVGDAIWRLSDEELVSLAADELALLGLASRDQVVDGAVVRQRAAYPVYDDDYEGSVAQIRAYLDTLPGLQTVGRNGMHRYNNLDHSMLTGLLAAHNAMGERHDLWRVNAERSYLETLVPSQ